jgi:hypothetical protein
VRRRLPPPPTITVHDESNRRAILDAADYADVNMPAALFHDDVHDLWRYALAQRTLPGLFVEFGVFQANSINFFAGMTSEILYGFDSFEGLKEDWVGWSLPKGHFSLNGRLPKVAPNVRLIKGWFDQTLPEFLASNPGTISFLHIDCDTYESTTCVLNLCAERIVPGTVVLFDEYFGYRGWRLGEFRAWREFIARSSLSYDYKAFSDQRVLVVVGSEKDG